MSRRRATRLLSAASALPVVVALADTPTAPAAAQIPRVERLVEIGCEDCGDARQFASTWDIAVTPAGDVLVVDRDAPTLRMFDKVGRPIWGRGRPGAGPGEYRFAMRAAVTPDGSVHVVDMRLRRLTRLGPDGTVRQSLTVPFFPAGVAVRRQQGELVFLTDDFKGGGTIERWPASAEAPVRVGNVTTPPASHTGTTIAPSIAVAPNGTIAYLGSSDRYEIHRLSPTGTPLPPIVRDIPRVRRTAEEIAATQSRIGSVGGASKAAAEGKQAGSSKSVLPRDSGLEFKPHAPVDALRYDDAGRLWVRTMRGDGKRTVFDIFAPSGAYVGELTVPARVENYSLAGEYLATAGERDDGVPVVVLWSVR